MWKAGRISAETIFNTDLPVGVFLICTFAFRLAFSGLLPMNSYSLVSDGIPRELVLYHRLVGAYT